MRFIRDAFLDIAQRASNKTFLIDKLTGFNDISILLDAMGEVSHPLNLALSKDINKNITLENVLIQTNGQRHFYQIYFIFDNTYWYFSSLNLEPYKLAWQFNETPVTGLILTRLYNHLKGKVLSEKIEQKTISEILQQKQKIIAESTKKLEQEKTKLMALINQLNKEIESLKPEDPQTQELIKRRNELEQQLKALKGK
jgi:hypothetical protein